MGCRNNDPASKTSLVLSKNDSEENIHKLRQLIKSEAPLAELFFDGRDEELKKFSYLLIEGSSLDDPIEALLFIATN